MTAISGSSAGNQTLSPSPLRRCPKVTRTMPQPLAMSIHSIRPLLEEYGEYFNVLHLVFYYYSILDILFLSHYLFYIS